MTEEEKQLLAQLAECYNAFVKLPLYHPADVAEFTQAIHTCQNLVFARAGMLDYGYFEVPKGSTRRGLPDATTNSNTTDQDA